MAADAEATLPALIEACKRSITADRRQSASTSAAEAWPTRTQRRSSARAPRRRTRGTPARSARRGCRRSCGRRSRTRTGRWSPKAATSSGWSIGCGTSTSTISSSATREAPASATARRRRSAPRWRTRSTAGCRSHSGRRRLHVRAGRLVDGGASPDSAALVMHNNRAYHQEVMHIQRMANRTIAASRARTSARRSTIRTSTSRKSRRAWASTRKDRSPTPTIWHRPSSGLSRSSNGASRR